MAVFKNSFFLHTKTTSGKLVGSCNQRQKTDTVCNRFIFSCNLGLKCAANWFIADSTNMKTWWIFLWTNGKLIFEQQKDTVDARMNFRKSSGSCVVSIPTTWQWYKNLISIKEKSIFVKIGPRSANLFDRDVDTALYLDNIHSRHNVTFSSTKGYFPIGRNSPLKYSNGFLAFYCRTSSTESVRGLLYHYYVYYVVPISFTWEAVFSTSLFREKMCVLAHLLRNPLAIT